VVYVTGEDDLEEIHRRFARITADLPIAVKNKIATHFNIIDFADAFELFTTKPPHGETQITLVPERICRTIAGRFDEVGLVIIDPISRFRGGDENVAADTTRFVQALQQIRDRLNTAVLCIHHVHKNAKANGTSQNNARGSSALIDGVRLVFELNVLSSDEIKKQYGVTDTPLQIVTLNCVKTNYGKAPDPLILKRKNDGSLEPFGMQAGDYLRQALLQEISIAGLSKSQFKSTYGGVDGKFGLSEKALVRKIDEYVADGLVTAPVRSAMAVTPKGQETLNLSGLSGQHPGK
jgi:RecA-family ATPase